MFKNKLILLTLITVVVVVAASIFVKLRAPQSEKDKPLFFPELAGQIESVNHISIENYAGSVNLTQIDDFWTIDEFDGYPALPDKVKSAVLGAADLKGIDRFWVGGLLVGLMSCGLMGFGIVLSRWKL